ncbi:hypothetical protein ACLKA6_006018 [Drosophila palustris]
MASRPRQIFPGRGDRPGACGTQRAVPGRPHDADYIVHSPYNSDQSRATTPNAGVGTWRRSTERIADLGPDEESGPSTTAELIGHRTSRATTPNAGVGDMEAFHGATGLGSRRGESGPQRLPNSTAIAQ